MIFFIPISFGPPAMSVRQLRKYKKYLDIGIKAYYTRLYSYMEVKEVK